MRKNGPRMGSLGPFFYFSAISSLPSGRGHGQNYFAYHSFHSSYSGIITHARNRGYHFVSPSPLYFQREMGLCRCRKTPLCMFVSRFCKEYLASRILFRELMVVGLSRNSISKLRFPCLSSNLGVFCPGLSKPEILSGNYTKIC